MTRAWWMLVVAGLLEVVWAIGLKYADGFRKPLPSTITIVAMIASFYLLAQSLKELPVGTGYAVWTGIGAVGTAIVGILLLGESRDLLRIFSIALIIAGIIGLKVSSSA